MGTTPRGLPWPEPSDPVRDGATAIRALAEAIDNRGGGLLIQAEQFVYTTQPSGVANHSFPKPFAATPVIILGQISLGAYTVRLCVGDYGGVYNPTAANFHLIAYHGDSNAVAGDVTSYVGYVAIGVAL